MLVVLLLDADNGRLGGECSRRCLVGELCLGERSRRLGVCSRRRLPRSCLSLLLGVVVVVVDDDFLYLLSSLDNDNVVDMEDLDS